MSILICTGIQETGFEFSEDLLQVVTGGVPDIITQTTAPTITGPLIAGDVPGDAGGGSGTYASTAGTVRPQDITTGYQVNGIDYVSGELAEGESLRRFDLVTDDVGTPAVRFYSAPITIQAIPVPVVSAAPSLSGNGLVGGTHTLAPATWDAADEVETRYLSDANVISGESDLTYEPGDTVDLTDLTGEQRARNTNGAAFGAWSAWSASNAIAITQVPAVAVTPPSISGTISQGELITFNEGMWDGNPALDHVLEISDDGSTGWSEVSGTTGANYTLLAGQDGKFIRLKVNAVNSNTGSPFVEYSTVHEVTTAGAQPAITLVSYDDVTGVIEIESDMPTDGNLIWAKVAVGDVVTKDGSGGWSGDPLVENGSLAMTTSLELPTTGDGSFDLYFYQRTASGADSTTVLSITPVTDDNTGPVPSNLVDVPGNGGATLTWDTNEDNGNAYAVWVADGAPVPNAAQIIAGTDGSDAAAVDTDIISVSATGAQTPFATVALTNGVTYDRHMVHVDARGNTSAVFSGEVTPASGDTTAPVLTAPTGAKNGSTGATSLGVDTNEGNGTLYWGIYPTAFTPSKAEIKAGTGSTPPAVNGSQTVSGTGTQAVSDQTGLTAATAYKIHYMHEDVAANQSNIATSAEFTTDAATAWKPQDDAALYATFFGDHDAALGLSPTSGAVDSWTGQSAGAMAVTQSGSARPSAATRTLANGQPVIDFDGTIQSMTSASGERLTASTTNAIFAIGICKVDIAASGKNCAFSYGDGAAQYIAIAFGNSAQVAVYFGNGNATTTYTPAAGEELMWSLSRPAGGNHSTIELRLNGEVVGLSHNSPSNTINWTANQQLKLGVRQPGSDNFDGGIARSCILNAIPSAADRQKIEGSFAWKYGTQGALDAGHPYKSAAP